MGNGKEKEKSSTRSSTLNSHCDQKTLLEVLLRDADPAGGQAFSAIADLTVHITNIEEELDSGGFADIHRGRWRNGQQEHEVAVKVLRVRKREDDGGVRLSKRLGREIRAWHRLDHPNIVKLLGVSYNVSGRPAMIMYWHRNGNATKYLAAKTVTTAVKMALVTDVARGLAYLHTLNPLVVHGDLKANNVLITEDGHAALTDFGLSQVIEDTVRPTGLTTTTAAGAIRWQAPEIMSGELDNDDTARLTTASDIWSFACTAYELFTGMVPYHQHRSTGPIVKAVTEGIKPRWEGEDGSALCESSDELRNLLNRCWFLEALQRPSILEVVAELEDQAGLPVANFPRKTVRPVLTRPPPPPPLCFPFGSKSRHELPVNELYRTSSEEFTNSSLRSPQPPPPPPPPLCFPFGSRSRKQLPVNELYRTNSEKSANPLLPSRPRSPSRSGSHTPARSGSYSPTATLASRAEKLTFSSDSESQDNLSAIPALRNDVGPKLLRSDTKKAPAKWGYGWGLGKQKEREEEVLEQKLDSLSAIPALRNEVRPKLLRSDTKKAPAKWGYGWGLVKQKEREEEALEQKPSMNSQNGSSIYQPPTRNSSKSSGMKRPQYHSKDSFSTLVGSALDRKVNDIESMTETVETSDRLEDIQKLMLKNNLDFYVVPSEDAHQSEYVTSSDKRMEWISGFSGCAGRAIISKTEAYLITDSRCCFQAQKQLDSNWHLLPADAVDGPKDWIEWLVDRVKDSKIGIDARMISHDKATLVNSQLTTTGSKLVYPSQNLVDLAWKNKPPKPRELIYIQPIEFTGKDAVSKLREVQIWIQAQPPSVPSYSKTPVTPAQIHVATLITSLSSIAYLLNLRGSDIPFNPLFFAYLFVALDRVILFVDAAKVDTRVGDYLTSIGVERKEYNDLWGFLRKREWGEGKILLSPQSSYAISLMLTHFRYTIAPSIVDDMKAVKNEVELEGMRRAYMRDGASFVKFLAWVEYKSSQGYDITEWEAAVKFTEIRRKNKHFQGLAHENMSASGPNAALLHYTPNISLARFIDFETPYLNDSGAQYTDGKCETTRTVHCGRPTPDQCEAYTYVLQDHIAIDTAVFPKGSNGAQFDILAQRAFRTRNTNDAHRARYKFNPSFRLHGAPRSCSSDMPLVPGHVVINEPGIYMEGQWGMRIGSALIVREMKTKRGPSDDIWLGFEHLTYVPIQTRMVKAAMLSSEEKQWLKDHNQRCREILEPYLRDDKIALKWLKREAERGIGIVGSGPGGITIDWD